MLEVYFQAPAKAIKGNHKATVETFGVRPKELGLRLEERLLEQDSLRYLRLERPDTRQEAHSSLLGR